MLATAVVMRVLKKYSINYVFIFELGGELQYLQLFKIALILFSIVLLCFVCQLALYNGHATFCAFTIAMIVAFAVLCFNPWAVMLREERVQLIKTLEHILIAPFGQVKFRHFFLADIVTSITSILQ